ncbi:hypothetical protein ACFQY0_01850 [Haloferula chungangensis]|uniref:Uncharacterized protein n=1 Tax=Haloferula chungangensis TaxID=1048331 RepID=A0ABW2L2Z4_9BACT
MPFTYAVLRHHLIFATESLGREELVEFRSKSGVGFEERYLD